MTEQFEKDVLALLRAGWNTLKVRDWAISAASGYGRFWRSPAHALETVNAICKRENERIRKSIDTELADTYIIDLIKSVGGRVRR